MAEGEEKAQGPNLAVSAIPPNPPRVFNPGRDRRKVARGRPGRGRVGGSQPGPPGASGRRFHSHKRAPVLLRRAALPGSQLRTEALG